MTITEQLNLKHLPGGAGGKGIATRANYLGISVILGVNLFLHAI